MSSLHMSRDEREAFLAGVHVAVISVANGDRGPITSPVWYAYEPGGDIRFTTGADFLKTRRIREAGRMTLCVQTEKAPYAYVVVEGPATIEEPDFERDGLAIAERYLGKEGAKAYMGGRTSNDPDTVLVRLTPETWRTTDYAKR